MSNQVTGTCGTRSDLADYSNKQWGGLISGFYARRQQCYVELVKTKGAVPPAGGGGWSADLSYNRCLDEVAHSFQHDFGGKGRIGASLDQRGHVAAAS